jgi:thioredoxin reductase
MDSYDVVVIGGGAAGLSGAVTLARARRSVLMVDAGEPRNRVAAGVHGFLTRDGMPPADLLAAGRAELAHYGGDLVTGQVAAARRSGDRPGDGSAGFVVELAGGRRVLGRRVLVATGVVDELPAVPGLRERWGRDVVHCPYCHGWEIADRAVGVLATGPLAVHQALLFRQWSADVTLFTHLAAAPEPAEAAQLAARGIEVVAGEVAALEVAGDRLTGVRLRTGAVVPRSVVVAAGRSLPRLDGLAGLGLATTEHPMGRFVPADPMGQTAVPGVWAAGNVTDLAAQVIHAAAGGVRAAAAINNDLIREDTETAVAAATTAA